MDKPAASRLSPALTLQALHHEQAEQARLLAAIRAGQGDVPAGWRGHRLGLLAHQRHARATACRALKGAYPVLARCLGDTDFEALAWWFWCVQPPPSGDLGDWGASLSQVLLQWGTPVAKEQAALAALEWAVHAAARAPDPVPGWPPGLAALQTSSPDTLWLLPQPGLSVQPSGPSALASWLAAQPAASAGALGEMSQTCEWALVRRSGLQVVVRPLEADQARFTRRLLAGDSLGQALSLAAPRDFQDWLRAALAEGWWRAVSTVASVRLHDTKEEA